MKRFKKIIRQKEILILLVILLVALFFRVFKLDIFYIYEHDQDLYSWIVKDIWIDHHLRLIGQVTSIEGVFIGPLFYYLLVPFFALGGMNPISAAYFATLIGLITVGSIYFVFQRFFGKTAGLFGAAIYATSLGPVFMDRWVVPTQPTTLWCVWLLYTVFSLSEGKTKSLIMAAILVGLVWHIHVALLPLTPLLLFSFFLAKQKLTPKIVGFSLAAFLFLTTPFWIFEIKHNFLQTKSLFFTSGEAGHVLKGWVKFLKILDATKIILRTSLFDNWDVPYWLVPLMTSLNFAFAIYKKLLTKKQIIVLIAWVVLVLTVQMVTNNPISEYYVSNLTIIPVLLCSLVLAFIWKQRKIKYLALLLILIYSAINTYFLVNKPEDWHHYKYKEQTVEFIRQDASKNNYQCISEDYINTFLGTAVGFRYLTWWKGLHLVKLESGAPKYTIVIPYDAIDKSRLSGQFHYFGVIAPPSGQSYNSSNCNDPKYEPIPLLGFTN